MNMVLESAPRRFSACAELNSGYTWSIKLSFNERTWLINMDVGPPVLLVEDDENDIFFTELAFEKAGLAYPLMVVRDGQEAICYLGGQGIYADREKHPSPCLVLLDIAMPFLTGFDVLEWLQRQSQGSKLVPIVVLTSSSNPSDIQKAMALGADDYRVKPANAADLVPILRELQSRWLTPGQSPDAVSVAHLALLRSSP